LHRALRDDRWRTASAHAHGHALHVHERVRLSEDGLRGDARPRARVLHLPRTPRATSAARTGAESMRKVALYLVLAAAALTLLYPFLWMAATTFKPAGEMGTLSLVPDAPTLDNYRLMLARAPVGR